MVWGVGLWIDQMKLEMGGVSTTHFGVERLEMGGVSTTHFEMESLEMGGLNPGDLYWFCYMGNQA